MKVKICGLTNPQEAEYLNRYHADFAGMVLYYPKSKRNITIELAGQIMKCLHKNIKKVAVVVSPTLEQAVEIEKSGFDYIQIHGHIPEHFFEHINIPVLKAFNVTDMDSYEQYHRCEGIAGYVFDAIEPGSGNTFDWSKVSLIPKDEKLLLLAGGLTPDNVAEAIRYVQPDGVDVSTGVECDSGVGKSEEKIRQFIQNANCAAK